MPGVKVVDYNIFFMLYFYVLIMCMFVSTDGNAGTQGGHKRESSFLELELQVSVSGWWEPNLGGAHSQALNCGTTAPSPQHRISLWLFV